jgi:flavin-dependent dehydrogenase
MVAVVGAGLAGSLLALALARRGVAALVDSLPILAVLVAADHRSAVLL